MQVMYETPVRKNSSLSGKAVRHIAHTEPHHHLMTWIAFAILLFMMFAFLPHAVALPGPGF